MASAPPRAEPLDERRPDVSDRARSQRQAEVARAKRLGEGSGQRVHLGVEPDLRRTLRHIRRRPFDGTRHEFSIDPGDRRLPSRVDLGDPHRVGTGEGRGERVGEVPGAGEEVRLEDGDEPAVRKTRPGGGNRRTHFPRMMGVVIDDRDARHRAQPLESPDDAGKVAERGADRLPADPERASSDSCGQRVLGVVPAGDPDLEDAAAPTVLDDPHTAPGGAVREIPPPELAPGREPEGARRRPEPRDERRGPRIVCADEDPAAPGHPGEEP